MISRLHWGLSSLENGLHRRPFYFFLNKDSTQDNPTHIIRIKTPNIKKYAIMVRIEWRTIIAQAPASAMCDHWWLSPAEQRKAFYGKFLGRKPASRLAGQAMRQVPGLPSSLHRCWRRSSATSSQSRIHAYAWSEHKRLL